MSDESNSKTEMQNPHAPGVAHEFVSPKAKSFRTTVMIPDGKGGEKKHKIEFVEGRCSLEGEIAKAFDEQAMTKIAVSQYVKRVNREAAERLVAEHRAAMQNAAAKGMSDTGQLAALRGVIAPGSTQRLGEIAPNNPEALEKFSDELAHGDLMITESAEGLFDTPAPAPQPAAAKTSEGASGLKMFGKPAE